ncbi:MAG: hypothetical protein J6S02_09200 [Bacteroidaceae bacterium]|nr:hypothetical protein [Bacteroidaceae bacterium]
MKKCLMFVPLALLALLTSCDNTALTAGAVEDAVMMDVSWENPQVLKTFNVGYFEVSEDRIIELRQLQAAGMITLKVEKAVEEKVWRGWYNSSTDYIDHYYAEVALTEKGQKYVFEGEVKKGRKDIIKDMKDNEKEDVTPDYMLNLPALKVTTLLPNPSSVAAQDETLEALNVNAQAQDVVEDMEETVVDSTDAAPELSAYERAKAKVNATTVQVILGEMEFVKAKEIYCPEEWQKLGKASCKIIIAFTGKTPFGYVYGAPAEGHRDIESIELKRYEDLGWVVED